MSIADEHVYYDYNYILLQLLDFDAKQFFIKWWNFCETTYKYTSFLYKLRPVFHNLLAKSKFIFWFLKWWLKFIISDDVQYKRSIKEYQNIYTCKIYNTHISNIKLITIINIILSQFVDREFIDIVNFRQNYRLFENDFIPVKHYSRFVVIDGWNTQRYTFSYIF